MACKDCPRWQGSKYSKWGDCNHIIGVLLNLTQYSHILSEYYKASPPFDPHDVKYYEPCLHRDMLKVNLPKGVRRDVVKEDDIDFNEFGNERIAKVKVCHFQTHKDYDCGGCL